MQTAFHTTTTVLPGHKIEFTAPDLREGDTVEVVVISPKATSTSPGGGRSIFEIIADLKGHRNFQTPAEVDAYLKEERDSWDR